MKYVSCLLLSIFLLSACGSPDESKNIAINDSVKVTLNQNTPTESKQDKADKIIIENYNILDVTQGKEVRGITTLNSKGYGKVGFIDNAYSLAVIFENLPEPKNGDFYEGWVIQKEPFNFISTGEIEYKNGMQVNTYTSNKDYTSHDFYVLTLEPNDGDPAPADHILEGILEF